MNKIWIFALVLWSIIGGACSDDVSSAHNESGKSSSAGGSIEIIPINDSSSSYSRSSKTVIKFPNIIEIKTSSSS